MLTIEFKHSNSLDFHFIIEEAQKYSLLQINDIYRINLSKEEAYTISQLLKRIRHKRVYIDGVELPWREVFHYSDCYSLQRKSYDYEQYCHGDSKQYPAFNIWGCIQTMMPLSSCSEWLCYGNFDLDGTFIFDKTKIRHYLLSNTHAYRFCPALKIDRILKILDLFPETVNPKLSHDWHCIHPVTHELSISMVMGPNDHEYAGVAPVSGESVQTIYQQIIKKLPHGFDIS